MTKMRSCCRHLVASLAEFRAIVAVGTASPSHRPVEQYTKRCLLLIFCAILISAQHNYASYASVNIMRQGAFVWASRMMH